MKIVYILKIFFVGFVLSGCVAAPFMVSASHFIPRTSGDAVNFAFAKTIIPGTATKSDVEKGMGKPNFTSSDGGAETWKYEYHKEGNRLKSVVTHDISVGDSTTVIVVFRGDVVVAVAGADFNDEKKTEEKFGQGETQLIAPFYQGRQMIMAAQPSAAPAVQTASTAPPPVVTATSTDQGNAAATQPSVSAPSTPTTSPVKKTKTAKPVANKPAPTM